MNVTPSQNQPQYRQTHANPAFKALTIGLKHIPQELQPTLVNAIKAQMGDGDKLILPELKQKGITKAFIGFNPDKIIIAVVDASSELKQLIHNKLSQILKTIEVKNPEKHLAITNESDHIFKTSNITTVATGHDDVYNWNYYQKAGNTFEHLAPEELL